MPSVGFIQGQIRRLERFSVRFLDRSTGRDVRDDHELSKGFPYQNAAADSMTVADWKRNRFHPNFAGFECDVIDQSNRPIPGKTLLSTVRKNYGK